MLAQVLIEGRGPATMSLTPRKNMIGEMRRDQENTSLGPITRKTNIVEKGTVGRVVIEILLSTVIGEREMKEIDDMFEEMEVGGITQLH